MLGWKLNHISKRGPCSITDLGIDRRQAIKYTCHHEEDDISRFCTPTKCVQMHVFMEVKYHKSHLGLYKHLLNILSYTLIYQNNFIVLMGKLWVPILRISKKIDVVIAGVLYVKHMSWFGFNNKRTLWFLKLQSTVAPFTARENTLRDKLRD